MPKKPSKSMQEARERIAQPPRSSILGTPATPKGYQAPPSSRPKGATPRKPEPMSPQEAKRAAKREKNRKQREADMQNDPLRHVTPLLLDEATRLWNT